MWLTDGADVPPKPPERASASGTGSNGNIGDLALLHLRLNPITIIAGLFMH